MIGSAAVVYDIDLEQETILDDVWDFSDDWVEDA